MPSKAGSKGTARKAARKKKRAPITQNAGQPSAAESSGSLPSTQRKQSSKSGSERRGENPTTREPKMKGGSRKSRCCCGRSSGDSPCSWFLSLFGLEKRNKVDDFVVFDDSSMEQSLLWTKDGNQPTAEDYLEFVPEHERGLAEQAKSRSMPKPAEDKCDY